MIDCGHFPEILFTQRPVGGSTIYNSTLLFTCLSGYWLTPTVTTQVATCTELGTWDIEYDSCQGLEITRFKRF